MAASTHELTRTGLTSTEAARLLGEHGPNEVAVRRPVPLLTRVVTQLRDPLIVVLLAAVVLTVVTGDYPDAIIIGFVVVANSAVGVAQELRAESAVAALAALAAPTARVHRDGQVRTVPAVDLVPGDVVDLTQGDIVPADGPGPGRTRPCCGPRPRPSGCRSSRCSCPCCRRCSGRRP